MIAGGNWINGISDPYYLFNSGIVADTYTWNRYSLDNPQQCPGGVV